METTSGGGMGQAFKRYITGTNAFVTDFSYRGEEESGQVCLGPDFPSKIEFVSLNDFDGEITASKGSMVAMGIDVLLEPTVVKGITAGIFGGEGFIMQKLSSTSEHAGVFVKGMGQLSKLPLEPGRSLRVSTGSLVAYTSSTLEFEVEMLPGVKNAIFGQGLFVTKIKNESEDTGYVWVQGLEQGKFVSEIGRRLGGRGGGGGMGMPIMMPGGGGGSTGGEGGGVSEAGAEASDRSVNSAASVMGSEMAGDSASSAGDASPGGLFGDEAPEADPFLEDATNDEPGAFDDFGDDGESFSSEGGDAGGDEGGGLLSSIWDMINDD